MLTDYRAIQKAAVALVCMRLCDQLRRSNQLWSNLLSELRGGVLDRSCKQQIIRQSFDKRSEDSVGSLCSAVDDVRLK